MAKLLEIARHGASRAPMERLACARVTLAGGVEGDARGRPGPSQLTLVSREAWQDACRELGQEVPWLARRANLLVEGVELRETTGQRLRIGPVLLEITGETEPCAVMDRQRPGLRAALTPGWRAGVSCRVLEAGDVRVGDEVRLEASPR